MSSEKALAAHRKWAGKIEIKCRAELADRESLSLAYTPGVAAPCLEIARDPELSYVYTRRGNMIAVVTDGTAVLGLGDIGPEAAMPVMEGKCALFKTFAGVDAVPICLAEKSVEGIVAAVKAIAPSFGGINLEDISAPRCFEIEARLKKELGIPVFHDDQHGTAIVVLAALKNAAAVVSKELLGLRVVISGAGAAGTAIADILLAAGIGDIVAVDRAGALRPGLPGMNAAHTALAARTNPRGVSGGLAEALSGADAFIGVSGPNLVTPEMVKGMAPGAIVFALANPVPEIMPDAAQAAGAAVAASGRSDFKNQINNLLAFPGIFRGALDSRAREITLEMKLAAASALAALARDGLCADFILPDVFDPRVAPAVAGAVADAVK